MKAEREAQEASPCCCVLIDRETGEENICNGFTSGPDEPFCGTCEDRHPHFPTLNNMDVTQRLPEVAS